MKKMKVLTFLMSVTIIIFGTSYVMASNGISHVSPGQLTGGGKAKYSIGGSSASPYISHTDHAATNWSNISSKVKLTKTTSESQADIKIYYEPKSLPNGVLGEADNWKYNIWGQATEVTYNEKLNGVNYDKTRIIMDTAQFNVYNVNKWGQFVKLVGHEMGHALSLGDFNSSPSHTETKSWMYVNQYPNPISNSQYPSADDASHLKHKWGN